jgi:multidrug resistance protein
MSEDQEEQKKSVEASNDLERGSPAQDLDEKSSSSSQSSQDPNLVDWDGPDDPKNPRNWPLSKKAIITGTVSLITLLTPLGSSMFAPGVPEVMEEFQSTNLEMASFVVSVYLLGYTFGPLLIAPMSEMYGRLPIYHTCNVLYIIFNVACALAPSMNSLIVFRFFAGTAGSAPLTIGAGTIADMTSQERRGSAMAIWALGPLLGPVIGPVAGGYLTADKGWRWTFWVLAIAVSPFRLLSIQTPALRRLIPFFFF